MAPWVARRWERIRAADPGRVRFRIALRSVLAAAITARTASWVARAAGRPPRSALVGVFVAMLISFAANEPTRRRQTVTSLLMALAAIVATAAEALALRIPLLAEAVFLAFVFGAVYLRKFGPRWGSVGLLGFLIAYAALYFQVSLAQLPWASLWIAIGVAASLGVRFALVRERPATALRQVVGDYRAAAALLLDVLAGLCRDGRWHRERRIRDDVARLSEIGLLLQDQLASTETEALRNQVFESELAAERAVWAVARVLADGDATKAAAQLERAVELVRSGARQPIIDGELGQALTDLVATLPPTDRLPPVAQVQLGGAANQAPVAARQAVQATVACGAAMVLGHWLSATRWQWAVLAAFVVFARATTVSDSVVRAWERTLGTILGAGVGFAAAELLHGDTAAELVLVFVCIFVGYYFLRTTYTVMVAVITTMLALLYDLMGMFTPGLMIVRLEETIIGAVAGACASMLILPTPAARVVREKVATTLRACADLLEAVFSIDSRRGRDLTVELQHRMQEAWTSARPLMGGILAPLRPELPVAIYRLSALVFYAAQLMSGGCRADPSERERAHVLAAELRELATAIATQPRWQWRRRHRLVPPEAKAPTATHCIERMEQVADDLGRALQLRPA